MESVVQFWLAIWLYVMAAIACALGYRVWKHRRDWSRLDVLCALAIIVLVCHVLEEWVWPGGLHYSYNITFGNGPLSGYPMNRLTDMITNFGAVVLGCVVLKVWGFRKPAAIAVLLFCLMEVLMHTAIAYNDYQRFHEYGMVIAYDPGLVTSLFGFLPIGVGLVRELFLTGDRPTPVQWVLAIVGTMVGAWLLISLPEGALKSADTPYAFTDPGYYARYYEQYDADHGVTY